MYDKLLFTYALIHVDVSLPSLSLGGEFDSWQLLPMLKDGSIFGGLEFRSCSFPDFLHCRALNISLSCPSLPPASMWSNILAEMAMEQR